MHFQLNRDQARLGQIYHVFPYPQSWHPIQELSHGYESHPFLPFYQKSSSSYPRKLRLFLQLDP